MLIRFRRPRFEASDTSQMLLIMSYANEAVEVKLWLLRRWFFVVHVVRLLYIMYSWRRRRREEVVRGGSRWFPSLACVIKNFETTMREWFLWFPSLASIVVEVVESEITFSSWSRHS